MGRNSTDAVKAKNSVCLIPWDTENNAQSQRLFDQRVACTWDYEVVEEWKGTVRKGTKLMYWIVRLVPPVHVVNGLIRDRCLVRRRRGGIR